MTDANLNVKVTATTTDLAAGMRQGVQVVKDATTDIDRQFKDLSKTVADTTKIIGTVFSIDIGASGVRQLMQIADEYQNVSNRIRSTVADTQQLKTVQSAVFDVAQKTGQSLDESAKMYQRLEQVIQGSGKSQIEAQTQAIALTKTLNEEIVVSGASAGEASRSIMDLVHGLGGGVIHAQQLRPIMRQMPDLAKQIADGLGVGAHQFEEMVKQGLPAESILKALANQSGLIAERFEDLPVTFERAWTKLHNAVETYIGKASQASVISDTIKASIIGIANNIDAVARGAEAVGAAMALWAGGKIAGGLATLVISLKEAVFAQGAYKTAAIQSAEADIAAALTQKQATNATIIRADAINGLRLVELNSLKAKADTLIAEQAMLEERQRSLPIGLNVLANEERLIAVRTELAVSTARVAELETVMAAAQVKTTMVEEAETAATLQLRNAKIALAGATAEATGVMGLFSRGASGLLALVGGWPMIFLAAAAAVVYLVTRQNELDVMNEKLIRTTKALADAHGNLTPEIEKSTEAAYKEAKALEEVTKKRIEGLQAQAMAMSHSRDMHDSFLALYEQANATSNQLAVMTGKTNELAAAFLKAKAAAAGNWLSQLLVPDIHVSLAAIDALAEGLDKQKQKFDEQAATYKKGNAAVLEYQRDQVLLKESVGKSAEQIAILTAEVNKTYAPAIASAKAFDAVVSSTKEHAKEVKDAAKATKEFAADQEKLSNIMSRAAGELGPIAKANEDYARRAEEATAAAQREIEIIKQFPELGNSEAAVNQKLTDTLNALDAARLKNIAAAEKQADVTSTIIRKMKEESDLAGLSGQALFVAQAVKQAQDAFAGLGAEMQAMHPLTDQQIEDLKAQAAAVYELSEQRKNDKAVFDDWMGIVGSGLQSLGKSIADMLTGSIKSWKDFGKALIGDAKQFVAQIIEEFLKLKFINPILNSLFGGGAGGSAASLLPTMANAGGGIGGIGSMIGGGMNGLLAPGSFLGSIFGGAELAGPPIAGAATAGTSVGMLGSIGSFLAPVGIAIAAATVLNSLTGGAVFGTSWKPTGSTTSYGFGESGGSVSNQISESRKTPLFGLFGGSTHKTVSGAVDPAMQQAMTDLFNGVKVAMQTASNALGIEIPQMISGAFKQVYDKKGNLTSQFSTVLGQVVKESFEDFQKRIQAENILAVVGKSAADAGEIAQQWRGSASTLLAGAQFLLAAQVDITHGNSLLGASLADTTKFVQAATQGNETLIQTYARLQGATTILQQAVDLMGVNLGKTREDFVSFAAGVATAAGGLQQAQALWSDFFKNFYSSSEQAKMQLDAARKTADTNLTGLGLGTDTTMSQFRAIFEAQLPTLSAEATAQWLQAAQALAAATQAQATYDQSLGSTTAAVTQTAAQLEIAAQALQAARHDYQDFMNGIRLSAGTLDAFGKSLLDIQKSERDNIARANELARAAGMAGAAEADLATIHLAAARAAAQAIAELEHSAQGLVAQLYGDTSTQMNTLASSSHDVAGAVSSAANSMQDFADSLLTGDLSPLNDRQKLSEGMRQLMAASAAGNASEVQRIAQEELATGRRLYASGSDYTDLFNQVQGIVGSTRPAATGGGGGGGFANEANNAVAQMDPAQRALEAKQLAQMIADLAVAQGKTIAEVEKQLGVPTDKLAKDLGMTTEELNKFILSLENITSGYGDPEVHGMIAGPKPGAHTAETLPSLKPVVEAPTPWQISLGEKLDKLGASLDKILAGVLTSGTAVASEVQDVREGITTLVSAVRQPSINEPYSRNVSRGTVLTP